jgi:hypothetical protein
MQFRRAEQQSMTPLRSRAERHCLRDGSSHRSEHRSKAGHRETECSRSPSSDVDMRPVRNRRVKRDPSSSPRRLTKLHHLRDNTERRSTKIRATGRVKYERTHSSSSVSDEQSGGCRRNERG